MIKVPVDILGNIWGSGTFPDTGETFPEEGDATLTLEQFSELFKEAVIQAGVWWEPSDGLRGLLDCNHEFNENLQALIEHCAGHIRTRHYISQCPFCEGKDFRYLETPTGNFQVVCQCGARGPLKPSMDEALKAFSV